MIQLIEVKKVFNGRRPNEFVALDGINLDIDFRKVTVLKGPSGSGKTTLLSLVGCMARPTSGRIMLAEREITSLPERFLTQIRRRTFGFIFQHFNLIKGITALENVMAPALPEGEGYSSLVSRATELLGRFGLRHKVDAKVEWLSGGEAQRVSIARAMINDPEIIIADEPTAHLDRKLSEELMGIVQMLNDQGKTVIIASHDPLVHESRMVHRLIDLRDGKILR